jgi:hypothetical protein
MKRALWMLPFGLVALALAAAPRLSRADEPRPAAAPTKAELKKRAEERKEAVKEKIEKKKEEIRDKHEERAEERRDEHAGDAGERREGDGGADVLRERWQKLRETRKERRRVHREEIKKALGDLQRKPLVKAELKMHAWRMARLNRIRAIAETEGKTDTVARVDKLIAKENQRDQKRMDLLKSKGGEE